MSVILVKGGYGWAEYSNGVKVWYDYESFSAKMTFLDERNESKIIGKSLTDLLDQVNRELNA